MIGNGFTISVIYAVSIHPFTSVPITVYTVVTNGFAWVYRANKRITRPSRRIN